jgi:hypothetical protein
LNEKIAGASKSSKKKDRFTWKTCGERIEYTRYGKAKAEKKMMVLDRKLNKKLSWSKMRASTFRE